MNSKMEWAFLLMVALLITMFTVTIFVAANHLKATANLRAIYHIAENNAHENEIAWTIMDIIKGE